MPSLQIRNLPEDIYQFLALRAERSRRSLAQQAIVELRRSIGADVGQRRRQVLADIKRALAESSCQELSAPPEDLIRADRDR